MMIRTNRDLTSRMVIPPNPMLGCSYSSAVSAVNGCGTLPGLGLLATQVSIVTQSGRIQLGPCSSKAGRHSPTGLLGILRTWSLRGAHRGLPIGSERPFLVSLAAIRPQDIGQGREKTGSDEALKGDPACSFDVFCAGYELGAGRSHNPPVAGSSPARPTLFAHFRGRVRLATRKTVPSRPQPGRRRMMHL
jgi:hypothetical protein